MAQLNFPNAPFVGALFLASNGFKYRYDGTKWVGVGDDPDDGDGSGGGGAVNSVNGLIGDVTLGIGSLTDVETSSSGHIPSNGQALVWNAGMGHWMPGTISSLDINSLPTLP